MYMLKRRGAKTDPCWRPFFRRRSLLGLLSPVVRAKLLFRISSIIIWTMCFSGTSLSCLQVRPRCQTVSSSCQIEKHGTGLLFCLKRILSVLRKQNDLVHARLSVSKSSMFLWKQGVGYWIETIVDQSFEDLVRDTEQRDGTVAL